MGLSPPLPPGMPPGLSDPFGAVGGAVPPPGLFGALAPPPDTAATARDDPIEVRVEAAAAEARIRALEAAIDEACADDNFDLADALETERRGLAATLATLTANAASEAEG